MKKFKVIEKINLTGPQRKFLEDIWFVWGNGGRESTMANHKFVQHYLEHGEDCRKFYKPSKKLTRIVDSILSGNIRRNTFQPCEKCGDKTFNEIEVSGRWAAWCGCG